MHILVADDCSDVLSLVTTMVKAEGFDVTAVDDGQKAWTALRTGDYPIAILDWMMPGFSGPQICELLSKYHQATQVYVIILTAKGGAKDFAYAMKCGASDYVTKPFSRHELVARVRVAERTVTMNNRLTHAQKLESIGQIAAGIAHEINTPIQFIADNTKFLHKGLQHFIKLTTDCQRLIESEVVDKVNPNLASDLRNQLDVVLKKRLIGELPLAAEESLEGIEHISGIVMSMKKYSHPGSEKKDYVDLNEAIRNTINVGRNEWKYVADVETDLDEHLPPVFCFASEISQVILNILVNAAHAIAEKKSGKGKIKFQTIYHRPDVEIRIRDTGVGIPEEIRAQVFDPFFTTKSVGVGTGQGLAIAWDVIVNKHGGSLQIESESGIGTMFLIRFDAGSPPLTASETSDSEKHKILLVDPQPGGNGALRSQLSEMEDQCEITYASSSKQALDQLDMCPFDVIATDLHVPEMNGLELLEVVKERYPNLIRILLADQDTPQKFLGSVGPVHQFLNKSSNAKTIKQSINRACDLKLLLSQEPLKQIVANLTTIPSVPCLYRMIEKEFLSSDGSLEQVGNIIRGDLGMTAKILQLVNSGFFGLCRKIIDPTEAVVMLGMETTRALVLSHGIFSQYDPTKVKGYSMDNLMTHSFAVAHYAKAIAVAEGQSEWMAGLCYLSGMIHDIGQLVLASNCSEQFSEAIVVSTEKSIPLYQAEIEVFGTSHADVGAYLLGIWGLPSAVVEAVAYHHTPEKFSLREFSPVLAVYAANVLSQERDDFHHHGILPLLDREYLIQCGMESRLSIWRESCHKNIPQEISV